MTICRKHCLLVVTSFVFLTSCVFHNPYPFGQSTGQKRIIFSTPLPFDVRVHIAPYLQVGLPGNFVSVGRISDSDVFSDKSLYVDLPINSVYVADISYKTWYAGGHSCRARRVFKVDEKSPDEYIFFINKAEECLISTREELDAIQQ